jgi:hypothetical protein
MWVISALYFFEPNLIRKYADKGKVDQMDLLLSAGKKLGVSFVLHFSTFLHFYISTFLH